jgi:hypothetical protein
MGIANWVTRLWKSPFLHRPGGYFGDFKWIVDPDWEEIVHELRPREQTITELRERFGLRVYWTLFRMQRAGVVTSLTVPSMPLWTARRGRLYRMERDLRLALGLGLRTVNSNEFVKPIKLYMLTDPWKTGKNYVPKQREEDRASREEVIASMREVSKELADLDAKDPRCRDCELRWSYHGFLGSAICDRFLNTTIGCTCFTYSNIDGIEERRSDGLPTCPVHQPYTKQQSKSVAP